MNKTNTYIVMMEVLKGEIRVGEAAETNDLSDVFFQRIISEVTHSFQDALETEPDFLVINIISGSQFVEKKIFKFEWSENNTFQLIKKHVVVEGNLIDLGTDIEDNIKEEVRKWTEVDLMNQINEALDNNDKETFMDLTEQLNKLRKSQLK